MIIYQNHHIPPILDEVWVSNFEHSGVRRKHYFSCTCMCDTVDVNESEKVPLSIGSGFSSIPDIIKSIAITENM